MARPLSKECKQQWKENILQQRNSGLSAASWCHQHGIAVHTFYYWQSKLFSKDTIDRSAFSEIVSEERLNTSDSGIVLEYRGVNIHISQNFEVSVLKTCLEILKGC
jgi:hypothetical protein